VLWSRDAADEQRDDLVADELVHDPAMAADHVRPDPVEVLEELPKLVWSQALADPRRATDVGEQERQRYLRARTVLFE
jgi:hypothetical protein